MPATSATDDTAAQTLDEQFLELICSDANLLAAEFDAIIAAEWPKPPADRPGCRVAGERPGREVGRATERGCGPVARPRHPGIGGWVRQRSPPRPDTTYDKKEGR